MWESFAKRFEPSKTVTFRSQLRYVTVLDGSFALPHHPTVCTVGYKYDTV